MRQIVGRRHGRQQVVVVVFLLFNRRLVGVYLYLYLVLLIVCQRLEQRVEPQGL
jgi:hypothetical protein